MLSPSACPLRVDAQVPLALESAVGSHSSTQGAIWMCHAHDGFREEGQASLVISTLEALAVLISLKLFHGEIPAPHRSRVLVAPTWTDNRGNGAALNKLMTTGFPASAVLM